MAPDVTSTTESDIKLAKKNSLETSLPIEIDEIKSVHNITIIPLPNGSNGLDPEKGEAMKELISQNIFGSELVSDVQKVCPVKVPNKVTRPKVLKNLESSDYLYDRLYNTGCPRVVCT